jgi:hypothetical protein
MCGLPAFIRVFVACRTWRLPGTVDESVERRSDKEKTEKNHGGRGTGD